MTRTFVCLRQDGEGHHRIEADDWDHLLVSALALGLDGTHTVMTADDPLARSIEFAPAEGRVRRVVVDGYHWAKHRESGAWVVVHVSNGQAWTVFGEYESVVEMLGHHELGPRVEQPTGSDDQKPIGSTT